MSTKTRSALATLATMTLLVGCGSRQVNVGDTGPTDAVTVDSTADVRAQDMALDAAILDLGAVADMNLSFPAVLEGVWLIGWSGGMNHFSWVRFSKMATPSMTQKDVWVLDGKTISSNLPLWECSGKAGYWMGAAANTIYLDIPATSCASGVPTSQAYVFSDFNTSGAGAPKDVILSATVQVQATLQQLRGYKYPDTWCDAAMSACKKPF